MHNELTEERLVARGAVARAAEATDALARLRREAAAARALARGEFLFFRLPGRVLDRVLCFLGVRVRDSRALRRPSA